MAIDFEKFVEWASGAFGDIVVTDKEVKVNSIFCDDYKKHLWCAPGGGLKERRFGAYHCWRTSEKGDLIGLVMKVEKCDFTTAMELIGAEDNSIAELTARLNSLFDNYKPSKPVPEVAETTTKMAFPESTFKISELSQNDPWRHETEFYLSQRKLPIDDYHICIHGEYGSRIIIPYYMENKLVYWNGRSLHNNKSIPKYLGPDKYKYNIGKGDVIYLPTPIPMDSTIYITEGEFDSKSLSLSGLYSCALGGKSITENQILILKEKNYSPIVCLDNDQAGQNAFKKVCLDLQHYGFVVKYVRPPGKFKDWNDMYKEVNGNIVKNYIEQKTKVFDHLLMELGNV